MTKTQIQDPPDHVDVLIVGAGLSGIGTACHLRARCPGKSIAILESRDAIGGTWDLFRYPGIRSDSDMFTLGYSFRPWEDPKAIADGPSIRSYIRETAAEHGIDESIHFGRRVVGAGWSSPEARWSIEVEAAETGETTRMTCGFLFMCTGYYSYDEGYTPEFPGRDEFGGEIIHPQHWPESFDPEGKRIVVVGSGATAVTLVPALADRAAHVTMLQRSPSYMVSMPSRDPIADVLLRRLPARVAYPMLRWKNVLLTTLFYELSRRRPELAKRMIRRGLLGELPPGYEVDTHFNPRYQPWDQRVCLVPDGDLFEALRDESASIVTDRIDRFTESGIRTASGEVIEADVIVTATGLNLLPIGGISLSVDGREVDFPEVVGYKGLMFSGVPNAAVTLGYTNATWTLKCDLAAIYVCRLINHMDANGYSTCTPRWPGEVLPDEPFLDLMSGYVKRSIDKFPRQGPEAPWRLHQSYGRDVLLLKRGAVEDGAMEFSR